MTRDVLPLAGYTEPYGLLCATLQDATAEWRGEIAWAARNREELDAQYGSELVTWQSRPKGPSIGAIMLHMVIAELFWFEVVALGREVAADDKALLMWDEIDVDTGVWPAAPNHPLSWYFDLQDRFRERSLGAVKLWDGPESTKPLGDGGEQVSLRWVLGHVIQHESYHGGQIVMLYDLWKNRPA